MTRSSGQGRFITFEGGEGAGKSTQLHRLGTFLQKHDIDVVTTREPGGTQGAEEIRNLVVNGSVDRWAPMTELLLMMAARSDHLEKVIRPALDQGKWVISDRFFDSSRVYQGIAGGLGLDIVDKLHGPLLGTTLPDLTLLLDIDVETGLARRLAGGGSGRFEAKKLVFHQTCRDGFLKLAQSEPNRFTAIDAAQSEEEIAHEIHEAVAGLM